jgi:hypothetical protein
MKKELFIFKFYFPSILLYQKGKINILEQYLNNQFFLTFSDVNFVIFNYLKWNRNAVTHRKK